jgi:hypothetical protein
MSEEEYFLQKFDRVHKTQNFMLSSNSLKKEQKYTGLKLLHTVINIISQNSILCHFFVNNFFA